MQLRIPRVWEYICAENLYITIPYIVPYIIISIIIVFFQGITFRGKGPIVKIIVGQVVSDVKWLNQLCRGGKIMEFVPLKFD